MAKKILSIQVGNLLTKVALIDAKKKNPHVFEVFYVKTPEHAVEDGYIREKEALASVLRDELGKRQITEKNVVFTINCSRIITREVTIPNIAENKIPAAIETQAKDFFPMDVSNYMISYRKVGVMDAVDKNAETSVEENKKNKKKELKLLLVAVPDNLLANYVQFAEAAAYTIEGFDYVGNSVMAFIAAKFDEPSIIVQFEEQTTIVSLIEHKKLVFQRVAPYGYSTVLDTVLGYDIFGCETPHDAFEFLLTHNLLRDGLDPEEFMKNFTGDMSMMAGLLGEAYEAVCDSINYYNRVVTTALEYYKGQFGENFHGTLHLIGDGASIQGVADLFESEVVEEKYRGQYVDLENVPFTQMLITKEHLQKGILAVVGAMIDPLPIMPKEMRARADKKNSLKSANIIIVSSVLISVILILLGTVRQFAAVTTQSQLKARISELAYIEDIYYENEAARRTAESYEAFDALTYTDNEKMYNLITDLEKQLPTTMKVQSLTIEDDYISCNISCDTKMTVAKLLLNLKNIAYLTDFEIPSMVETEDSTGNKIWQFSISAKYTAVPESDEESTAEDTIPENSDVEM